MKYFILICILVFTQVKAQDQLQDFSYCLYKNIDIDPIYDSELLKATKLVVIKVAGNQCDHLKKEDAIKPYKYAEGFIEKDVNFSIEKMQIFSHYKDGKYKSAISIFSPLISNMNISTENKVRYESIVIDSADPEDMGLKFKFNLWLLNDTFENGFVFEYDQQEYQSRKLVRKYTFWKKITQNEAQNLDQFGF